MPSLAMQHIATKTVFASNIAEKQHKMLLQLVPLPDYAGREISHRSETPYHNSYLEKEMHLSYIIVVLHNFHLSRLQFHTLQSKSAVDHSWRKLLLYSLLVV